MYRKYKLNIFSNKNKFGNSTRKCDLPDVSHTYKEGAGKYINLYFYTFTMSRFSD